MNKLSFKQFLTEDRQQPILAYHATSVKYLRSIIKHGLVPNFSDSGYGSNETNEIGVSLKALPGVYFTPSGNDADLIGKSMNYDYIIVVASVIPNSLTLDEDRIHDLIDFYNIRKRLYKHEPAKEIIDDIMDEVSIKLKNNNLFYAIDDDLRRYLGLYCEIYNYAEYTDSEMANKHNEYKQLEFKITKQLKTLAKKSKTFKIDGKVGFSGRNRIVGLYYPNAGIGWGSLGYFDKLAYHKYKTPMELLSKI
jgi:hypothetical protein